LSGDYGIVLPLFIATVLATVLSRHLRPESIYTEELRRRGIPWERTLEERIATTVRARDILEMDPPSVDAAASIQVALDIFAGTRARVIYVTGGENIAAIDLHRAALVWRGDMTLDERTKPCGAFAVAVTSASPDDSLATLSDKLFAVDWGELPVVEGERPSRLLGTVSRRALLAAFDREILKRDLLFTRVVWQEDQTETADYLELPRGQRVEVIQAPIVARGRPVDLDRLRAVFHVLILGVQARACAGRATEWIEPEAVERTDANDRWMVIGKPSDIDRLRHQAK
jgi:CIC family chloride channel protein